MWLYGTLRRRRQPALVFRCIHYATSRTDEMVLLSCPLAPILSVGCVLVLTALMSWCGASNQSCSTCLALSSYLLILLALAELILAVVIFTQGARIDEFLRDHQAELKLT